MQPPVPGVYDQLLTEELEARLAGAGDAHICPLPGSRAAEVLAWHLYERARSVFAGMTGQDADQRRLALCNQLLALLPQAAPEDRVPPPARLLTALPSPGRPTAPPPPLVPLRESALLVNGPHEHSLLQLIRNELATADRVDLIVAFLRWSGLRPLLPTLQDFFARGGRLRVLTSTYTGGTEARAVEALAAMGAELRVCYETQGTRLHAKAWLFERDSGFSTGLVGSSNLSRSALVDGLEWNVRLGALENRTLLERFQATFAHYWAEPHFEAFLPGRDEERLRRALRAQRGEEGDADAPWSLGPRVSPHLHQQVLLETLAAERALGRHRNLVVAATGTGKTWLAAFDYAAQRRPPEPPPRLLFVAHRREILEQARAVFRLVLQDRHFGELLVHGETPRRGEHVFASISSLTPARLESLAPDHFAVLIVDEFHHAAAESYDRLLRRLRPRELLGLTATPERADGQDILGWFDGRVAGELRLWDALEQGLLVPFHYFGVHDGTSLAHLSWQRGRYDLAELQAVYNGNTRRAELVLQAVRDHVVEPGRMRALGFCVSVVHARFMAEVFTSAGLAALAVHGETPLEERRQARAALEQGRLTTLFTVDLFNEGVDIPCIDTVLFLRPTESLTIFLQQLGRGLRRAPGKALLTVLDFIGDAHRSFRFDLRMRALTPASTRREALDHVERDFPSLPPGCVIQLEARAREVVLRNIRACIEARGRRALVEELRAMGPGTSLTDFLRAQDLDLGELYRNENGASWTGLRRAAGFERRPPHPREGAWARAFARLLHLDDEPRLRALQRRVHGEAGEPGWDLHLCLLLGEARATLRTNRRDLQELLAHPPAREELVQLLALLRDRLHTLNEPLPDTHLRVHATYTRAEILAALGLTVGEGEERRVRESREGVLWDERGRRDLLFITLDKSASTFRETTRYEDYPLSERLFHWQSQSTTRAGSRVGERYQNHLAQGSQIWLFVRERPKDNRGIGVPYVFLGPARYVRHSGERPMSITWELVHPMPPALYARSKAAAG